MWTTAALLGSWIHSFLSCRKCFETKKSLCGKLLSEIRIHVQVKKTQGKVIILLFHLTGALVVYGRWTRESPVLKMLALIACDYKIKQITFDRM